jgi:hypothetical protein
MCEVGDCFWVESNTRKDGRIEGHLFIVALAFEDGEKKLIIVNIDKIGNKTKYDKTTILHKGDHEFITQDSFVNYRFAYIVPFEKFKELIAQRIALGRGKIRGEVIPQICSGILTSKGTKYEVREAYENHIYKGLGLSKG